MPAVISAHKEFPVVVYQHPSKGRCFRALRDISAGSLVLRSCPYAVIPDTDNKHRYCYKCMKKSVGHINSCGGCKQVYYCSAICQKLDSVEHSKECAFFGSLDTLGFSNYTLDYFRLLTRVSLRRMAEIGKLVGREESKDDLTFDNVWDLCTNMEGFDREKLEEFGAVAKAILEILETQFPGQTEFTLDKLVELICKEECNSFGIYSFEDPTSPRQGYGLALYPSAVYFNHSCYPNIVHTTHGVNELFFAARDIKKDEELCITYIDLRADTASRMGELKEIFQFDCDCERCQVGDGSEVDLKLMTQLCSNDSCFGVYLPYKGDGTIASSIKEDLRKVSMKCNVCQQDKSVAVLIK